MDTLQLFSGTGLVWKLSWLDYVFMLDRYRIGEGYYFLRVGIIERIEYWVYLGRFKFISILVSDRNY